MALRNAESILMAAVWVCKAAGQMPGDREAVNKSLSEMRMELAMIIADENILRMETRPQPVDQQSDCATGIINAYEITEEGWNILTTGVVGPRGFGPCPGS